MAVLRFPEKPIQMTDWILNLKRGVLFFGER